MELVYLGSLYSRDEYTVENNYIVIGENTVSTNRRVIKSCGTSAEARMYADLLTTEIRDKYVRAYPEARQMTRTTN